MRLKKEEEVFDLRNQVDLTWPRSVELDSLGGRE